MPTIKNITLNLLQGRNDYGYLGISCPNLVPLKQDTVLFKGTVLKKSDFKGSDLAVIERYKPNIQQFKSKEDLQTFDLICWILGLYFSITVKSVP